MGHVVVGCMYLNDKIINLYDSSLPWESIFFWNFLKYNTFLWLWILGLSKHKCLRLIVVYYIKILVMCQLISLM